MFSKSSLRYLILVSAILFGLALTVLSVLPLNRIALGTRPSFGSAPATIQKAAHVHIAVHLFSFGALACAAWFAADLAPASRGDKTAGKLLAFGLVLLLAYGTEYLQHKVYRMPLELNDVTTNFIATVFVFGILALIHYVFRKRQAVLLRSAQ